MTPLLAQLNHHSDNEGELRLGLIPPKKRTGVRRRLGAARSSHLLVGSVLGGFPHYAGSEVWDIKGSLTLTRNVQNEQVWCMRIKKDFPSMEWWLGRGYPLDPYLKGVMVDYLRSAI